LPIWTSDLVEEAMVRREEVPLRFLEIPEDLDRNPEPWLVDEGMTDG
jgi:hypothetical protein